MALNTAKLYKNSNLDFNFQAALTKPFLAILSLLLTWQTRASMRRKLQNLDKNNLTDMGITPSQAKREAAKPFFWHS